MALPFDFFVEHEHVAQILIYSGDFGFGATTIGETHVVGLSATFPTTSEPGSECVYVVAMYVLQVHIMFSVNTTPLYVPIP